MSTLNVFVAAILTNYANAKTLYRRRALHAMQIAEKPRKGISLPNVYARLSQLLPSKNAVLRTGEPWAQDVIRITFQGLESSQESTQSLESTPSLTLSNSEEKARNSSQQHSNLSVKPQLPQDLAVVMTEAKILVPLPKSVVTINEQVDRDIAFHADSGAFAFRLRTQVGETVIPALVERIIRVERLVEYVQVLQTYEPQLACESVTLGMISFTYTARQPAAQASADKGSTSEKYSAKIDFNNVDKIVLVLTRGDPHLRILDLLNQILNSPQGFMGVAKLLPVTAPALRGLSKIQTTWSKSSNLGECFTLVRAAEWYVIRYVMKQAPSGTEALSSPRQFNFTLKLQDRKGDPFWHLQRVDTLDRDGDDLEKDLQKIWNAVGEKWLGMRLSGVARPADIEALLSAVDDVVRVVASKPMPPTLPANSTIEPPSQQAQPGGVSKQPLRPPIPNQQQRPMGNTKQQINNQRVVPNQNQGKTNGQAREVVILD